MIHTIGPLDILKFSKLLKVKKHQDFKTKQQSSVSVNMYFIFIAIVNELIKI